MQYFSKLFSKAPFANLQLHMEKACASLSKLSEMFQNLFDAPYEKLEKLAAEVSNFEHEADLIKNDIRSSLPRSYLFTIDRANFLEILALQDNLADTAEDIAGILIIKELTHIPELRETLSAFVDKNMETAFDIKEIIFSLDGLIEASFGGPLAENTKEKISALSFKEHESDLLRRKMTKILFSKAETLTYPDFYLWMNLIENIGLISHFAEKEALRIRMMLDM